MPTAAVVIEPSYIAFDTRDFGTGEDLERRIMLLAAARGLIVEGTAITVLTSNETYAELLRTGYYPYNDRLAALLSRFGLDSVYSANDVRVIIQDVINRSRSLEEYVGVGFALYDSATTTPDCAQYYADRRLLEMFVDIVGVIAAGFQVTAGVRNALRVSSPTAKYVSEVQFAGELEATDPDVGFQGPVVENVVLVDRYLTLIQSLDGLALWRAAEDEEGLVLSLFVGAAKRGIRFGFFSKLSDIPVFSVGSEFFDSLAVNQAGGGGRFSRVTYEKAVSIICGDGGQAMWRGKPNNQVERADGALAWRSHVTSRHEALRLMYWTYEDKIEFANLGVKNELVIAEGNRRALSSTGLVLI